MQIKVRIPRNSSIRQIVRDTYTDLYRKFKETNPKDKNYTRAKLAQNIRQATSINGKVLSENDIVNSSFDAWTAANYKQVYHFHWYFAVTLQRDKDGNVIAVVQDAHYEGEHYNGPRLSPPYSDTNESRVSNKVRITESQLREIIAKSVKKVLNEWNGYKYGKWDVSYSDYTTYDFSKEGKGKCLGVRMYIDGNSKNKEITPTYCLFRRNDNGKYFWATIVSAPERGPKETKFLIVPPSALPQEILRDPYMLRPKD